MARRLCSTKTASRTSTHCIRANTTDGRSSMPSTCSLGTRGLSPAAARTAQGQSRPAALAPRGRHLHGRVRARRHRPRPIPRRMQHGPRGDRLETQRLRLWRRQMQTLDQDKEPHASGLQQGQGCALSNSIPNISRWIGNTISSRGCMCCGNSLANPGTLDSTQDPASAKPLTEPVGFLRRRTVLTYSKDMNACGIDALQPPSVATALTKLEYSGQAFSTIHV
jgi:hypothetical protein